MTKLEQLIDILEDPGYTYRYSFAKSSRTCLMCGSPASQFTDKGAESEYEVSALCQKCQDEYLRNKKSSEV